MKSATRRGSLAGAIVGAILLAVVAVWLLRAGGSGPAALVALWLWLLPAIGLFALLGWLMGAAVARLRGRS